jgi:hypothetical protein
MALGESGAGLEALVTVALEAAHSIDTVSMSTEAGLSVAFVLI